MAFVAQCSKCGLPQTRQTDGPCSRCGQWCAEQAPLETVTQARRVPRGPVASASAAVVFHSQSATLNRSERATLAGVFVLLHGVLAYFAHDGELDEALRTSLIVHVAAGLALLSQMTPAAIGGGLAMVWLMAHPVKVEAGGLLILFPWLVTIPLAFALLLVGWPFGLQKRVLDFSLLSLGAVVLSAVGRLLLK